MGKLWTVVKAIIAIGKIADLIKSAYNRYVDYKIAKHYGQKKEAAERLKEKLKKAKEEKDDEAIKELHRKLHAVTHSHELPDSSD